jgi:phosphoglycolate phosphatase-like HAD superfamily hydrolase
VLLLFDIDGTLLQRAAGEHRDAIYEALRSVHGVRNPTHRASLEVAGCTDAEIVRALLTAAGVSTRRIDERADDVRIAACAAYAQLCPDDLRDRHAPGVERVLADLAARDGIRLSLVTGNLEAVARLKLGRAGLAGFFAAGQGGFGSDAEDRTELPPIARRRAGDDGTPYPRARTVVVGDTPNDIACARADGVRVVALATGPFGADQLREADAVAHDARELGVLLERLA